MIDNIGIAIITSSNLKDRYNSCKNTWTKDFSNVYFFGGNGGDENLISINQANEDYNSHFLKQQLGFKYMYEDNPNFDWYCMTSCDAILFKDSTFSKLSDFNFVDEICLAQSCGFWTDSPYIHETNEQNSKFTAIAGGGGFFVSNSLMKKCYDVIDDFNDYWTANSGRYYPCSDVAFAYMIYKEFNIKITNLPYILGQHPQHYINAISGSPDSKWYKNYPIPLSEALKYPMSFHYVKPNEMKSIYEKYK